MRDGTRHAQRRQSHGLVSDETDRCKPQLSGCFGHDSFGCSGPVASTAIAVGTSVADIVAVMRWERGEERERLVVVT